MTAASTAATATATADYRDLERFAAEILATRGVPADRAASAATALCYGDLTGLSSHGLTNLSRLYLPLLDDGRVDPTADMEILTDRGAAVRVDARRALGLWAASEAMRLAMERAATHGVGLVSLRGGTHLGCAGYHASLAAAERMVGLVASNCGGQRIARPPGGLRTLLGTNPLSFAAPAGDAHPFVLDMSTTVVPTGRVRAAARAGQDIPPGWLADEDGSPVTDPAALDRGDAHLLWLGGQPETGAYKGFGLGLMVEAMAALVSGSGRGSAPEALDGDGRPSGTDDDIGYLIMAVAPGTLRDEDDFLADAAETFGTVLDCPPADGSRPVRYPGWAEGERAARGLEHGVPLAEGLHAELCQLARAASVAPPRLSGGQR